MRMDKISAKTPYTPSFLKFKDMFLRGKLKLKSLMKDVFEKSSATGEKYISRDLPNSVGSENEVYNSKGKVISFFKIDIEKMSKMNQEEAAAYRQQLVIDGKYFYK